MTAKEAILKIFIEIPTWLGDAVMTTPAIENIVKTYPEAKLTIYGSFVSTRLFLHHPNVEKIFIDESKKHVFLFVAMIVSNLAMLVVHLI